MPDTRKTAMQNNGTFLTANVQGIALSTLIQKVLSPFDPNGSKEEKSGGSLLVKMDIEGGEYSVLKELAASPVLCNYVKLGNNATLTVEFHLNKIKDLEERQRAKDGVQEAKEKLKECGVFFKQLPDYWTE
jgi:hypothetical protein